MEPASHPCEASSPTENDTVSSENSLAEIRTDNGIKICNSSKKQQVKSRICMLTYSTHVMKL